MVITSQRTLYNVDLHLSMLLGRDYMTKPNTTLNEKFDVLADVNVPEGMYPNFLNLYLDFQYLNILLWMLHYSNRYHSL